jgi:copper chaperone
MRHIYEVQNIRCGGCAATVTRRLGESGIKVIEVSPERQQVVVEIGDMELLEEGEATLAKLGYPLATADNRLADKARGIVSCAMGRISS